MGRHGEPGGYRDDLSILLLNEGINFQMVGSMNDGTGFYPHHEGHSGYRADEIDDNLNNWLRKNPPDLVLLHIGTNDISQGESNETTILDIENILDKIYNKDPNTTILICSLIPRFDNYQNRPQRTEDLNNLIWDLYLDKLAQGFDIYYVPQNETTDEYPTWQSDYMDDNVHPNDLGYHVMAETFFEVLQNILNPNFYLISGNTKYYKNNNPIDDVVMSLSGGQNSTDITNIHGFYEFVNLPGSENYTVTPAKNKILRSENGTITMYNAALALRHAVGVETLDQKSQIAADVDKDGIILAYDAALIARYVVELPVLADDHVGEWVFSPISRNYQNLQSNKTGQDFSGILLGDVDGAWSQGTQFHFKRSLFEWISQYNVEPADSISVPIRITVDSLLSFELDIDYPTDLLNFASFELMIQGANLMSNISDGNIKIGGYSEKSSVTEGILLNIRFTVKDDVKNDGILRLNKFQINNFQYERAIANLNILESDKTEIIQHIWVGNNYPNPFNNSTIIPYQLTQAGEVKISIYNVLGKEIKTLIQQNQAPGKYKIMWDGTDGYGISVANGIYVYQVKFDNRTVNKTMIKLE